MNQSLKTSLDRVPDEFFDWVKKTVDNLNKQYQTIEAECRNVFQVYELRNETAEYFQTQRYPHALF